MKLGLLLVASLLMGPLLTAQAEPRTQEWNYTTLRSTPENLGSLAISVNAEVKTPDGKATLEVVPDYDREDMVWPSHLRYPGRTTLIRGGKGVAITFWIKGPAGSQISVRVTDAASTIFAENQSYDLTGDWQKIEYKAELKVPITGRWVNAPRLLLEKTKKGEHYFVGPVTCQTIE
ncbi:MAG: hypothetical protein B9S32_13015 [Verrucomicrobia bacterium Tous-C9LFEB]|nr:MAG: hypothetical protein B9S32_13015 [Verrucomicrobia bacterium Tous-C9LFEB]